MFNKNELSEELDFQIINSFLKFKNLSYETHKYFTDGASSKVILLNNKYLIKQNAKETLEAEIIFLSKLSPTIAEFFQKIVYVEPEYKFVVYEFIEGDIMKNPSNVEDAIEKLKLITSNYSSYDGNGFGYLGEETSSWTEFLKQEIQSSSKNTKEVIPNNSLAFDSAEILEKYNFTKKLLHGDFGTHNFVTKNDKFIGVIDPMPVIGDPLYDLLFAICSNTKILTFFTLDDIYSLVNEPKEKIKALFAVVLYSRISRCLKYHPKDINIYMNYWKKLGGIYE